MRLDLDPPRSPSSTNGMATIVLSALPCAPRVGRDVGFAAARPGREVEDALDRLGWQAGAVVGDRDAVVVDGRR